MQCIKRNRTEVLKKVKRKMNDDFSRNLREMYIKRTKGCIGKKYLQWDINIKNIHLRNS